MNDHEPEHTLKPIGEVKLGANGKLIDWYSNNHDLYALPVGTKLYTAQPAPVPGHRTEVDRGQSPMTITDNNNQSILPPLYHAIMAEIDRLMQGDPTECSPEGLLLDALADAAMVYEQCAFPHLTDPPAAPDQPCKWPGCMSEKEQKDLADQIYRELYGDAPDPEGEPA